MKVRWLGGCKVLAKITKAKMMKILYITWTEMMQKKKLYRNCNRDDYEYYIKAET